MDLLKKIEEIGRKLPYMSDAMTFEAFCADLAVEAVLGEEKYLQFIHDAAKAVRNVRYDLRYDEIIALVVGEYITLLEKYEIPDDIVDASVFTMFQAFLNGRVQVFAQISRNEGAPDELPKMPEGDIDNLTMATIFAYLPPQPEIGDYLKEIGVDYDYDHLHMVTWFSAQMTHGDTPGYTRREHNYSAKTTYNRLLNPYSLMWIAAALEEDPEVVKKAAAEAEKVKTFAEKCGIVRKAVSFSRIYELALRMAEKEEAEMNGEQE